MITQSDKWCFACALKETDKGLSRAAAIKAKQWERNARITIAFLEGTLELQARIRRVATEWLARSQAQLVFDWVDGQEGDIRVSFSHDGSWSYLGTDCKRIDPPAPTMNFGWLDSETEEAELRRVVLHEFGHALGLTHEHLNPVNPISWDRDAVISDLSGHPNHWSLETIERNMFDAPSLWQVSATSFDADSIMLYAIPERWTTDGFSSELNSDLSEKDIFLINDIYGL